MWQSSLSASKGRFCLDPSKIRAGSHKIGKWQCDKGEDHGGAYAVYARTLQGRGCPYCANKKLSATNSLVNFPAVFKEFHPTKNGFAMAHYGKRPYETSVLVVVRALRRHEWQRAVYLRTQYKSRCPRVQGKHERAKRLLSEDFRRGSSTFRRGNRNEVEKIS